MHCTVKALNFIFSFFFSPQNTELDINLILNILQIHFNKHLYLIWLQLIKNCVVSLYDGKKTNKTNLHFIIIF